jgi:hypothetical protein
MKTLKSAFARTAIVLAFVVAGCASAPFERGDIGTLMHDSSQLGGE